MSDLPWQAARAAQRQCPWHSRVRAPACGAFRRRAPGSRRRALFARCQAETSLDALEFALRKAVMQEDYAHAASLRDQLQQHPENVSKRKREDLTKQLQNAVATEDFEAAVSLQSELDSLGPDPSSDTSSDTSLEVKHTSSAITRGVQVQATSAFIPHRSNPDRSQFFYVYKIRIENHGDEVVQLRSRTWRITDASGHEETVRGPGVVGKQPVLGPGAHFEYMSACPLKTKTGTMMGTYDCLFLRDGTVDREAEVEVRVAPFLLTTEVVGQLEG